MTTADVIMLTLWTREKVCGRTKLLRRATELPIDSPIVQGEYGPYPENGFDVLEMLDNMGYIIQQQNGSTWEFEITETGKYFVYDELRDDVSPEEWRMLGRPL